MSMSPDRAVKTFVMLSGGSGVVGDERMDSLSNFKRIRNINIIDVYGSEDNESIFKQLISRTAISKDMHNDYYQRLEIKGANHFYQGRQTVLVETLDRQLDSLSEM